MPPSACSKTFLVPLSAALPVILIDQVTKVWAANSLLYGEAKTVISGFFNIVHAQNPGVAFSLLADFDARLVRPLLIIVTILAIAALLYAVRILSGKLPGLLGLGLVIGGAVGNLIDRVRLGYVIDFIDIYLGRFHWPAFNVADIGITVGVFLIAADMFFESKQA
jgi:signal peptidase II